MNPRPLQLRARAAADIDAALATLSHEAGRAVALRFVDAVEAAAEAVRRSPNLGSLRFSYDLGIPDLRAWPLKRFPYVLFYVPHTDHIDVWRVLHSRRDIPQTFAVG